MLNQLEQNEGGKEIHISEDSGKNDENVLATPIKQTNQNYLSTPCKIPDPVPTQSAFTPTSHFNTSIPTQIDRFLNSPYGQQVNIKSHASPFLPFCRENLSPLIPNNDSNYAPSNSKRVLFSPLYFSSTFIFYRVPIRGSDQDKDSKPSPPGLLFGEEQLGLNYGTPEQMNLAVPQLFQKGRSPIRRLNFDSESQKIQGGSVPVEINKIKEFKQFTNIVTPTENKIKIEDDYSEQHNCKESGARFFQLRSSPIQMFNSFSVQNAAPYLTQTIGPKNPQGGLIFSDGKVTTKKMCCNCKKSHCLKLYCECFTNKTYCAGCNCINCLNTQENELVREKAMQATLERNPIAFDPKITRVQENSVF